LSDNLGFSLGGNQGTASSRATSLRWTIGLLGPAPPAAKAGFSRTLVARMNSCPDTFSG